MTYTLDRPTFALEWCRRLSASPDTLEPLQGGINNQVFRCRVGRHWFVLKGYTARSEAQHDRFRAEVEFLNYSKAVAPEFVPRLIHSDGLSRSVVLEHIEGKRFREGKHPRDEDISQAVTFMRRLNSNLALATDQVSLGAAEGFLSLEAHLQNIEQRLKKISLKHTPASIAEEARGIIERGTQRLADLQESVVRLIAQGFCDDELSLDQRCLSPSDFGFHNAIRTPTGVRFLDFEFAGWDDPAKAVSDFDLHPRVPVKSRPGVLSGALSVWNKRLAARQKILFPILKLKWACIILAVLNPDRLTQMVTVFEDGVPDTLLKEKLRLAKIYLLKD